MAFPEPRNPHENFPERAITKISVSKEVERNETEEAKLSPQDILLLVVAALRVLGDENGSSINEIRRILVSGGFISPQQDIRPGLILGLKGNFIRRPLSAIKAGAYGKYVEIKENTTGKLTITKLKGTSSSKSSAKKKVKRCQRTSKKFLSQSQRYRLAL